MKKLYLLLGPKGVGKSYISELLELEFGIKFFRVEDIWLQLEEEKLKKINKVERGRRNILEGLNKLFNTHQSVSMESTATSENFFDFVDKLKKDFELVVIKVVADEGVCLKRVKKRDASRHVEYESDELKQVNSFARQIEYEYDFLIRNNEKNDPELVKILKSLLS